MVADSSLVGMSGETEGCEWLRSKSLTVKWMETLWVVKSQIVHLSSDKTLVCMHIHGERSKKMKLCDPQCIFMHLIAIWLVRNLTNTQLFTFNMLSFLQWRDNSLELC